MAYSVIGIENHRIFTIQPDSKIYLPECSNTISYNNLLENVDVYFPETDEMK